MAISIKRVYGAPVKTDGIRVLVDRIWPRGIKKTDAKIDVWLKDVAPSTKLRQWFGHDPEKWIEFCDKYLAELKENPALVELQALSRQDKITLVYAARDEQHNNAVVLKDLLDQDNDSH